MKSGGKQPFRPKHPSSFHHDLWMRQELCPHLLQEHLGGWRNQLDFFWEFHGSGFSNYSCLRKLESRQGGAGGRSPPSQLLEWVWVAICHPLFPMGRKTPCWKIAEMRPLQNAGGQLHSAAWESTWGRVRGGDNSHCECFLGSLRWAICSSGQAHSMCSLNVNLVSFLTRDSSIGKTGNCPRVTRATIYKAFTMNLLTSFNPQK